MAKPTILIVEDDGILAIHLQDLLTRQGYEVLKPVPTGEKAILAVKKHTPDLVLMDIELGGEINGINTAEQLAASTDTPVIFLTGFSQDPLLQQAKIASPYGYLVKPVPERELAATIEMALHKHIIDHQIKVSEAKYRSLIEQASDGIFLTDKEGNYIEINTVGCSMLGYTREELLSMNMREVIAPEDLTVTPLRIKELVKGDILRTERQFVRRNGSRFPVEISGKLLDNGNTQGIVRDITERKQNEDKMKSINERFDLATRAANLGVWDWDILQNVLVWDETMFKLYGVEKERIGLGYGDWLHNLHPDDSALNNELTEKALRGECEYDTEFRVIWSDGSIHWIKAFGQVIRKADGTPVRMIGINFDITKEKNADEQLKILARFPGENPNPVLRISKTGYILYANAASNILMSYWNIQQGGYFPNDWKSLIAEIFESKTKREIDIKCDQIIYTCMFVPILGEDYVNVYGRDVTEQKEIDRKLRISEERYRLLFEEMAEGYALHEIILNEKGIPIDYRFLDVNPSFEKLTGLHKKDILGRTVKEILPQVEEYWIQEYGQVALTGKILHYENYSEPIGKWFKVTAFSPKFGQFAVTVEDITESKNAHISLAESEERFRQLAENVREVFWLRDLETKKILYISPAYEQIWGQTIESLYQDPETFTQRIHPDDLEQFLNDQKRMWEQKTDLAEEFRIIHPDGSIHWLRSHISPVKNIDGKVIRFAGIVEDNTENKLAEEAIRNTQIHFQSLIENAPDGIALIDFEGKFKYVSPSGRKNFGYDADEEINISPNDVTHPDDLPVVLETLNKTIQDPSFKSNIEYRFQHKNGTYRWIESTFTNLLFEPSVQAIVINFRDITPRREAEIRIQEQLDELRRWYENTLGREMRVIELKEEVNRALQQAGLPPRYTSTKPQEKINE